MGFSTLTGLSLSFPRTWFNYAASLCLHWESPGMLFFPLLWIVLPHCCSGSFLPFLGLSCLIDICIHFYSSRCLINILLGSHPGSRKPFHSTKMLNSRSFQEPKFIFAGCLCPGLLTGCRGALVDLAEISLLPWSLICIWTSLVSVPQGFS